MRRAEDFQPVGKARIQKVRMHRRAALDQKPRDAALGKRVQHGCDVGPAPRIAARRSTIFDAGGPQARRRRSTA